VVCGHSFGGITALGTTVADKRIRATISLDPWFFPRYKENDSGKFGIQSSEQASCLIVTEGFYSWGPELYQEADKAFNLGSGFNTFLENSKNAGKQAHITLLANDHLNQTDIVILQPLEIYLTEIKKFPSIHFNEHYMLNAQLGIDFLAKMDMLTNREPIALQILKSNIDKQRAYIKDNLKKQD